MPRASTPPPGAPANRYGVELTHLGEPLFDGAQVTKRELVDYLDAVADRILPVLRDRPLSVVRARPGQPPFMQKNLPRYAPDWIERIEIPAAASRRMIAYPLCQDRRTLVWLANQRAVEFHPTLVRGREGQVTELVVDLDPPPDTSFAQVALAAGLVREALAGAGLRGAVKTSGSRGAHVVVPVTGGVSVADAAAATRALAARAARLDPARVTTEYLLADRQGRIYLDPTRSGGASLAAVYGPRARPGLPVSFPVAWHDLPAADPAAFTIRTAPGLLGGRDPWQEQLPAPQDLAAGLIEEGHRIPVPRVAALHEGKRRAAAARRAAE
jgi:DNA ligase D-like protein (predicted polymerase)